MTRILLSTLISAVMSVSVAFAQQGTPFGVAQSDSKLPVEVTSDALTVKDDENKAIFTGNVVIGQGDMRLNAPKVIVTYLEDQSDIKHMHATGGVTLVSGEDAAEGREAEYMPATGVLIMTGNVLMTRGNDALTGNRVEFNTRTGTAHVTGRVKTLLRPGSN